MSSSVVLNSCMRERLRISQALQFAAQDREVRCAGGEMRIKLLLIGALAFCWGAFSTPASAQTISCASQDNGRQYRGADTRGGITLIRQNSNSPCIENQTWGYDGRGIWVDRGCRAEFQVGNFYPGGPGGPGSRGDTISCESTNNPHKLLATETSAACPSYSGTASWTFATCGFGTPTIKPGTTGSARSV